MQIITSGQYNVRHNLLVSNSSENTKKNFHICPQNNFFFTAWQDFYLFSIAVITEFKFGIKIITLIIIEMYLSR